MFVARGARPKLGLASALGVRALAPTGAAVAVEVAVAAIVHKPSLAGANEPPRAPTRRTVCVFVARLARGEFRRAQAGIAPSRRRIAVRIVGALRPDAPHVREQHGLPLAAAALALEIVRAKISRQVPRGPDGVPVLAAPGRIQRHDRIDPIEVAGIIPTPRSEVVRLEAVHVGWDDVVLDVQSNVLDARVVIRQQQRVPEVVGKVPVDEGDGVVHDAETERLRRLGVDVPVPPIRRDEVAGTV